MVNNSADYKRKKRCIRLFIRRMIFCVAAIAIILVISFVVTDTTIITNQMAMSQFENSNDWFVAMTVYQKVANVVERARNILVSIITGLLIWSGYDLAKTLNT